MPVWCWIGDCTGVLGSEERHMKHAVPVMGFMALVGGLVLCAGDVSAEDGRPPPRSEVVAWTSDATLVVLAEPRREGRRRTVDLVARRVPTGEVVASMRVFPGPCARVIDRRVAISHACAVADLRPALPRRLRGLQYHIAASERSRIIQLTLRADGSIVEHQLPQLGLVLRGRTEGDDDRRYAVLEVTSLGREPAESRILDRRPVRSHAQRRWTLLKAGENRYIIIGQGVLRRIGRRAPEGDPGTHPDVARIRPAGA
jgi:hypothetical protein